MISMKPPRLELTLCATFLAIGVVGVGAFCYSGDSLKALIFVPAISSGLLASFLSFSKKRT